MASNQYRPGQSPINPLYPGYYPGRKVPPKPRPKGPYPSHFTGFGAGDSFSKFMNGFEYEVEDTLRGPDRWFRERMGDDFNLSLMVYGESPSELPNQVLDNYETGSLPGGGFISLNLDPREWLGIGNKGKWMNEDGSINRDKEAPKKMLKKTLKGWAKSALNFQDLDTKARTDFWNEVASSRWDFTQHSALENAAYQFATGAKPNGSPQPENPLALDNIGLIRYKSGEVVVKPTGATGFAEKTFGVDLYKSVGSRATEFQRYAESPYTRDQKFDRFLKESLDSFSEEAKYAISLQPGRANEDVKSLLEREDFTKDLSDVGFKHRGLTGKLSKIDNVGLSDVYLKGLKTIDPNSKDRGIRGDLEELQDAILGKKDDVTHIRTGGFKSEFNKLKPELIRKHGAGYVSDLETYVTNMESLINSTSFQNVLDPKKNASELTRDTRNVLRGLNTSTGLKGQLKGRTVTGGDVFMKSLERQMLYDLNGELVSNGQIRKFIEGPDLKSFLLPSGDPGHRDYFNANGQLDPDAPLRGGLKLLTYVPRNSFVRDVEAAEEVISQLPAGKYSESYIFTNRIRPVIGAGGSFFSARGIVDKAMERVYKFGLVLGKDEDLEKRGWKINNLDEPGRLFGNRFSINANVEQNGRKTTAKIKTWGGKHYKNIEEYKTWMMSAYGTVDAKGNLIPNPNPLITKQQLDDLIINKKKLLRPEILAGYDFNKLMINSDAVKGWTVEMKKGGRYYDVFTKEFYGINLLQDCKDVEAVKERIKQIVSKQKEIDEFVQYLHAVIIPQFKKAGIDVKDSKFLYDLVSQLDHMKEQQFVTQHYLGTLQKIGVGINKFQEFLYKIPAVGYVARQVNAVKTIFRVSLQRMRDVIEKAIKEALQRVIAKVEQEVGKAAAKLGIKAIINAVAQSAAFLGDTVAPFIAHAIAWIITQLVILATKILFGAVKGAFKFGQRLMKGELAEYVDEANKKMDKTARILIIIAVIIILINALFSPLIGLLIPGGMIPGGILTEDPFSDGVPFTLSTFSPTDPTRRWSTIQQNFDWNINLAFQQYGQAGGTQNPVGAACGAGPKSPPPSGNRYANPITNQAYEIAYGTGTGDENDPTGLQRGFWGMFNSSPQYPQFFDAAKFQTDPNPNVSVAENTPYNMFWCTAMVMFSERAGPGFPIDGDHWSCTSQLSYCQGDPAQFTVYTKAQATIDKIAPGSIIFFSNGSNLIHVGIIFSKGSEGINTLESNNCDVTYFIPTDISSGCGSACPLSDPGWGGTVAYIAVPRGY